MMRYLVQGLYISGGVGLGLLVLAWWGVIVPGIGSVEVRIVKSGSMEPAVLTGGVVVIAPADTYQVGDIITYTEPQAVIPTTHRIVEVYKDGEQTFFITKGDANETVDAGSVASAAVLGRVVFTVPVVGYVVDFARQPLGFGLLVVLPALLIILSEIELIRTEWRKRRRPQSIGLSFVPKVVKAGVIPSRAKVMPPVQLRRMMEIGRPVRVVGEREQRPVVSVAASISSSSVSSLMWRPRSVVWSGVTASFVMIAGVFSYAAFTNALFSHTVASVGNVFQAGQFLELEEQFLALSPQNACFNYSPNTITIPFMMTIDTSAESYELAVLGVPVGDSALCDSLRISAPGSTPVPLIDFYISTNTIAVPLVLSGTINPGNRQCTFTIEASAVTADGILAATSLITVGNSQHNQCPASTLSLQEEEIFNALTNEVTISIMDKDDLTPDSGGENQLMFTGDIAVDESSMLSSAYDIAVAKSSQKPLFVSDSSAIHSDIPFYEIDWEDDDSKAEAADVYLAE